jgi:hypothetical protein
MRCADMIIGTATPQELALDVTSRPGQKSTDEPTPVRSPYHTPTLRVRGSLATLTQAVGSANGDAGQGMMV